MKGVVAAVLVTSAASATILETEGCSAGATSDWPDEHANPWEEIVDVPATDNLELRPDDTPKIEDIIKPDTQPTDVIEVPDGPATKGIQPDVEE